MNLVALPNIASFPSGVVGPTYGLEFNGTLRALRLMTNVFTMMGSPINNVGRHEVDSDAATKSYVDGGLSNIYGAIDANVSNKLQFVVAVYIDMQKR